MVNETRLNIQFMKLMPITNQQILIQCALLNIKKPEISKNVLHSLVLPKTLGIRSKAKSEWLEGADRAFPLYRGRHNHFSSIPTPVCIR